jgi:cysteine-rich repeat protein
MTTLSAHRLILVASLLLPCGCFSPHDPIIVSASGSEESAGTSDSSSTAGGSFDETSSATTQVDESTGNPMPVCGDGVVDGDEVCDDGVNDGSYGGCMPDCSGLGPHCGDGREQPGEACDDADEIDGNGCNNDCVVSGTILWTDTYDGEAHRSDSTFTVAVGPDDEVVATGLEQIDNASREAWIRRYAADGTLTWMKKTFGPSGQNGWGMGVAVDLDGSVFVGGRADALTEGVNGWARRYSDRGVQDWTFTLAGPADGEDLIAAVGVVGDGALIAVGQQAPVTGIDPTGWIGRISSSGNLSWEADAPAADWTTVNDVAVTADGEIVVVGVEFDGTSTNGWARKLSAAGDEIWTRTYDEGANEGTHGVAVSATGMIALSGNQVGGSLEVDSWVQQLDGDGTVQWTVIHETGGDVGLMPDPFDVAVDREGNVIAVGEESPDGSTVRAWMRKLTPDGAQLYEMTFAIGGPEIMYTAATTVTTDSTNAIVLGGHEIVGSTADAWVRKLAP